MPPLLFGNRYRFLKVISGSFSSVSQVDLGVLK